VAGWPEAKLGQVCDIVGGGTPKTSVAENWGGDIPWATPKDLSEQRVRHITTTSRSITVTGLSGSGAQILPERSVLLSSRAPIGLVAVNTVPMATNQGFKSLVPDQSLLDPDWLAHWLAGNTRYLQSLGNGATFKEISKGIVADISVPLPPLNEQRRLVRVLDSAEGLRASRRRSLQVRAHLPLAMFVEAFGDPHTVPRRWPTLPLHEACDAIIDCPHSTPKWTADGTVCLRTSNLTPGGWDWSDKRFVSEETFAVRSARGHLEPGDIVLSREGTVGVAAIVPEGMRACMGQRLVQVKPSVAHVSSEYLLQYLVSVLHPDRIGRVMVGSTARHLNVKELRALDVPIPPLRLQVAYSAVMQSARRQQTVASGNLAALDALFAALRHRAFVGTL
jgi:type I restriction enzyme S subunit